MVKGLWPFLIAQASANAPVVAVTSTGREAEELTEALADHLAPSSVAFFPSWETLPHERLSPGRTQWVSACPCCARSATQANVHCPS